MNFKLDSMKKMNVWESCVVQYKKLTNNAIHEAAGFNGFPASPSTTSVERKKFPLAGNLLMTFKSIT